MRNTWLILRREYLERVRSKAFILFTVLMPVFVVGIIMVPSKLASMRSGGDHHIVVAGSNEFVANAVKQQLENGVAALRTGFEGRSENPPRYFVEVSLDASEAGRKALTERVNNGTLEGFLWVGDDAIEAHKLIYGSRGASDFMEVVSLKTAVTAALMKQQLGVYGLSTEQSERLLRPYEIETIRIENGKESKSGGIGEVALPFLLMMMIYMTVLIYGVAVMRSVLEEKTSRVIEVLLSSATPRQMMAGKILGVGAVGLTQILIWVALGLIASTPAVVAAKPYLAQLHIAPGVYIFFPVFFLLGFVLYSTMYAAVAAMVNSDEEAQQMQWPVMLPIILCSTFAFAVIRQPNSATSFWLSLFPFTSPLIMFVRIVVQQPPLWQIFLSIGILAVSIYGMVALCSRIYRVGILMYGKRPTLPELLKWIKYA
ncbi:MAG TPA: ABC transporter permease [Clostridia bacterium]|nr:ABC transporter permease [Clostridia bacterium]